MSLAPKPITHYFDIVCIAKAPDLLDLLDKSILSRKPKFNELYVTVLISYYDKEGKPIDYDCWCGADKHEVQWAIKETKLYRKTDPDDPDMPKTDKAAMISRMSPESTKPADSSKRRGQPSQQEFRKRKMYVLHHKTQESADEESLDRLWYYVRRARA